MNPICNVVDISHHNVVGGSGPALSGFKQASAAGVLGVIHKATQGSHYFDPYYRTRVGAARAAGLLVGAYHFADNSDMSQQITNFLNVCAPDADTLVALDWEPNGRFTMSVDQARQWLTEIEQKLGRKAVLYSGNLAKEQLHAADEFFGAHRLWLAQYGNKWQTQQSWSKPWLWQYAEKGTVPGITGQVDHNFFDGTADELKGSWT